MYLHPYFTASSKMLSELAADNQKVLKKTQTGNNVYDEKTKKTRAHPRLVSPPKHM
jgi:hypothetical protein